MTTLVVTIVLALIALLVVYAYREGERHFVRSLVQR